MSSVLEESEFNPIGTTFNRWNKSSLNFPDSTNSFKFFDVDEISRIFTLIYSDPFNRLNFWSIKTLKILACVSNGISETSSINKVPLLALSRAPKEIVPSSNSWPNNSFS